MAHPRRSSSGKELFPSEPDASPRVSIFLDRTVIRSIGVVVFYITISVSITFFNKAVLTEWDFDYSNFIMLSQHMFTVMVLFSLKTARAIDYPPVEWSRCKQLFPLAFLYSLNVSVALSALSALNVPMYSLLKRMIIVVVLAFEKAFLNKSSSSRVKLSAAVIVTGILIAGYGDLAFDPAGYFWAAASCFVQASYLIYVAKKGIEGVDSHGMLFYNSLLSLPLVFPAVWLSGEWAAIQTYPHLSNPYFQASFVMNLLLGSSLNYAIFLCTSYTSPLTSVIAGQIKNTFTIVIGLFTFGGVELNALSATGLVVNSCGSFWYSWIKYEEKLESTKSKGLPKPV
eukprot:TRINITY_DN14563_c0_g1_i1.p1 TRINITY_DN14563_c0_g1~~TRINITY_DN14563_c0_g1_i1.p1  ORF type:complete len:341 (-),score=99.19 TRINITY_DN14563_c0_g1_i1:279-1301(-)